MFLFTTLSAHKLCLHLPCPATLRCSCMTVQLVGLYPQPGNRTLGTLQIGLSWFPPGSKSALEGLTDQTRPEQTRPQPLPRHVCTQWRTKLPRNKFLGWRFPSAYMDMGSATANCSTCSWFSHCSRLGGEVEMSVC